MTSFQGAVSVVTGGGGGIGRACALAFASSGSDVAVADVDGDAAAAVAKEIEAIGPRALAVTTDVGDRAQVEKLVDDAIAWQGHVDVYLSNAGIGVGGPPHLIPVEEWDLALRVNLWASIWAMRGVVPHMLERGSGHIVFMSSPAGLWGVPMLSPYVTTKFAMNGFAESLAVFLKGKGVDVSIAMPGPPLATNIIRTARVTYDEGDVPDDEMRATADAAWSRIAVPPEDLAKVVTAGIEAGSFYIFHSPQTATQAAERFQNLDAWLAAMSAVVESDGHGTDPLVSSRKTAAKLA